MSFQLEMHAEVLRDSDVADEQFEKTANRFLRKFNKRPGFTFFGFGTVTRETLLTVSSIFLNGESLRTSDVRVHPELKHDAPISGFRSHDELLHRRNSAGQSLYLRNAFTLLISPRFPTKRSFEKKRYSTPRRHKISEYRILSN